MFLSDAEAIESLNRILHKGDNTWRLFYALVSNYIWLVNLQLYCRSFVRKGAVSRVCTGSAYFFGLNIQTKVRQPIKNVWFRI